MNTPLQKSTAHRGISKSRAAIGVLLAVALLAGAPVQEGLAATRTWSGTTDNLWSVGGVGGNWSDAAAPGALDSVVFTGTANTSTNNDLAADTQLAGTTAITFDNTSTGGVFTLAGNRITLNGNITTLGSTGTPTHTISLDMIVTGNSKTFTTAADNNLVISGDISEDAAGKTISKAGAGVLTLSGDNSYSGVTRVNAGTLKIGSLTALGTSVIGDGTSTPQVAGTLDFNGFSITNSIADKAINGGTLTNTGAAVDLTGMAAFGASAARSFFVNGTGDITFGTINGSNGYNITKNGSNTMTLTGSENNANLLVIVDSGKVVLDKASSATVHAVNKDVTVNGGTLELAGSGGDQILNSRAVTVNGGVFDINSRNETITALQIGDGSTNGSVTGTSGILAVSSISARSGSASAILEGGTGVALTKTTGGTVILTGANTYKGVTTVAEGTLLVNGNQSAATGAVSVATGATLGGSGTIGGNVTVTGTLAPGSSIESLATESVSFLDTSTFAVELDSDALLSVGADLLVADGNLSLAGTVTLTLADIAATPTAFGEGTTFSLVNYTGTWNDGLFSVGGNAVANGDTFTVGLNTWQIEYDALAGGSNFTGDYGAGSFVNITVVPEPSTVGLLVAGLGILTFVRRNGRRRV